jgi:hypothetical protein
MFRPILRPSSGVILTSTIYWEDHWHRRVKIWNCYLPNFLYFPVTVFFFEESKHSPQQFVPKCLPPRRETNFVAIKTEANSRTKLHVATRERQSLQQREGLEKFDTVFTVSSGNAVLYVQVFCNRVGRYYLQLCEVTFRLAVFLCDVKSWLKLVGEVK